MKKFLVMMCSSLLLVACSGNKNELSDMFGEADENPPINEETKTNAEVSTDSAINENSSASNTEQEVEQTKDVQTFDEYDRLNEVIQDVTEYEMMTEEDNENNRVLLFEKEQKKVYKSVYVKKDQHLKVIDLTTDQPIYNDHLVNQVDTEIAEKNNALNQFEEYSTLSHVIDIFAYESKVQTDNRGSRVILFTDSKGKKVYKSVYTKKNQRLKVIQLSNDELLFNEPL